VDDADPVAPGAVEIEAGVEHSRDSGARLWTLPWALAAGIVPRLEAGASMGGHFEERIHRGDDGTSSSDHVHGVGDLTLGLKWLTLAGGPLGFRHALVPSVKLPTADDDHEIGSGEVDGDLHWVASRSLGERLGLHLTLGYLWIGGDEPDVVHGGAALDFLWTDTVQIVAETFAERERADGATTVVGSRAGVRLLASEALALDAAVAAGWSGDIPDWSATVGLTWTFGVR